MSLLDDHLLNRLPDPYQRLAAFTTEEAPLLWADYQRPTLRLYFKLLGETLLWTLGLVGFILFIIRLSNSAGQERTEDLIYLTTMILAGLFILIQPFKSFLHRLRYPKNHLYGLTKTHLLVLPPWQETPIYHALAELPTLKTFARTDGTFTVTRLHETIIPAQNAWEQPQKLLKEEVLFLDAIGDRQTVTLIQQSQRDAKALSSSNT